MAWGEGHAHSVAWYIVHLAFIRGPMIISGVRDATTPSTNILIKFSKHVQHFEHSVHNLDGKDPHLAMYVPHSAKYTLLLCVLLTQHAIVDNSSVPLQNF